MKVIGICGGIGAGKSVLSRIMRTRGYEVYDCDYEAKRMMDKSEAMIRAMQARWGEEIYDEDRGLDRRAISRRVFSQSEELAWLNAMVHAAVREDLEMRIRELRGCKGEGDTFFIESAILYSSGLYKMCDEVWEVTAPEDVRISRVKARNGLSEEEIRSRIRAQEGERLGLLELGIPVKEVWNV